MTVFRDYSSSDAQRSDRSASDRQRHREKVREAIKGNIADILSEESIIGQSRDRIVKVPIRGVKEYRFVYGDNPQVGTGDGQTQEGQVVGKAGDGQPQPGVGPAGDQPGVDYYETDVKLEELIEMMFEDLELPNLERKRMSQIKTETLRKRKGYRRAGIRVHLDKKRTARQRVRRMKAIERVSRRDGVSDEMVDETGLNASSNVVEPQRIPFRKEDLRYRRLHQDERPQSNALVVCIMDTSGSMDTMKKYLARSFFFLLYQFVHSRYNSVEVVFIAHDTEGKEVTEDEFFSKGQAGGTAISNGYYKALEVIQERYHPDLWNIYAFHCSDGDNFAQDNDKAVEAARQLCEVCNLFGYGEIKTRAQHPFAAFYGSSMIEILKKIDEPNFETVEIASKDDVWPAFKKLLGGDDEAARATTA
jgi:sporulation protein YhbH